MNCLHFSVRWNERELFAARIGHVRVPYCIGIQNCLNVAAVRICLRLPRPNVRGLVRGSTHECYIMSTPNSQTPVMWGT